MNQQKFEEVKAEIGSLKNILKGLTTDSVVRKMNWFLLRYDGRPAELLSPARECAFLSGLLTHTALDENASAIDDKRWHELCRTLERVFAAYVDMFSDAERPEDVEPAEWAKILSVSQSSFIHYFMTTRTFPYQDFAFDRIRSVFCRFDEFLQKETGIDIDSILAICDGLIERFTQQLSVLLDSTEKYRRLNEDFFAKHPELDVETAMGTPQLKGSGILELRDELGSMWTQLFVVDHKTIAKMVDDEKAQAFERLTAAKRSHHDQDFLPTDSSALTTKPLIEIADGAYVCHVGLQLMAHIYAVMYDLLFNSDKKDAMLERRGDALEEFVVDRFQKFMEGEGEFYAGRYEDCNPMREKDLVIVSGRTLFLIESKSSPMVEPWRDPLKSYQRLLHAFQGDKGVQKGFDQASTIRRRLVAGETVTLLDKDGKELRPLQPGDFDDIVVIVVTDDNFGPLAINLTHLLEKEADEPYPLVVDSVSLDALLMALKYKKMTSIDLKRYWADRQTLHGRVTAQDELEIAAIFVRWKTLLPALEVDADHLVFSQRNSMVFERIRAELNDGPPADAGPQMELLDFKSVAKLYGWT